MTLLFYTGRINCGKWTTAEEKQANELIQKFLKGECSDCPRGQTMETYLACKLNCPLSRINNKYVGKSFLKNKYLESDPDDFVYLEIDSQMSIAADELAREFTELIEEEQSRLVEYLRAPGVKHSFAPIEYLEHRDLIFHQKAMKIKLSSDDPIAPKTPVSSVGRKRSFFSADAPISPKIARNDSDTIKVLSTEKNVPPLSVPTEFNMTIATMVT